MNHCPVIGCQRERRGILCPDHWHMLSRLTKQDLRGGVSPRGLRRAIAEAIHEEQALCDSLSVYLSDPEITLSPRKTDEVSDAAPL